MNNKVVFILLVYSASLALSATTHSQTSINNESSSTSPTTSNYSLPSSAGVEELQPEQREVSKIDISFKEGPSISSSPVFNVYLGDRFYMFITYTGEHHVIKPEECKAFSGTVVDESSENVILWDKRSCNSLENNILMDNFNQTSPRILRASLYGFHFVSSSYVTIECTVRICRQNTTCDTAICPNIRKRRRRKYPSALGSSYFKILNGHTINSGADSILALHHLKLCYMFVLTLFIKTQCI